MFNFITDLFTKSLVQEQGGQCIIVCIQITTYHKVYIVHNILTVHCVTCVTTTVNLSIVAIQLV